MLHKTLLGSLALTVVLGLAVTAAAAHDETKYPDWSGQWSRVPDGGPPRYDPSKPIRKQEAPLKPEYQKLYEASLKDIDEGGFGLDTAYACIPQAMPRQMSGVSLMEFLFSPNVTHILYEVTSIQPRRIYTDGRDFPKNQEPMFTGYSIGKWLDTDGDGRFDTLEVETRNIRGPRTFDQLGLPTADDNNAVVKERLSLDKANKDLMHNEMTTTDSALTRPWTVTKNYRRAPKVAWEENNCSEGNQHVTIGKEVYFLSGDGKLMPSKKGQEPPDLQYFKR